MPFFGTENLRQMEGDLGKMDTNSSILPYKGDQGGLVINRMMSFNPTTADELGVQSSSGETQQCFNE